MTSRSSTRSKRKHVTNNKSASKIPYNATCVSLEISLLNACGVCKSKLEGKCGVDRNRLPKKNMRHISKRNRCEQRWTLEYVLTSNSCESRYNTYIATYEELNLEPEVELIGKRVMHKRRDNL